MTNEQAAMALRLTEAARKIALATAQMPNNPEALVTAHEILAAVQEIVAVAEQMTRKPAPVIFDPRQAAIAGVQ